jgi:hypothetical protein
MLKKTGRKYIISLKLRQALLELDNYQVETSESHILYNNGLL